MATECALFHIFRQDITVDITHFILTILGNMLPCSDAAYFGLKTYCDTLETCHTCQ